MNMNLIVLKQWLLTKGHASPNQGARLPGGVNKFPGEREFFFDQQIYQKYTCFYNLFKCQGLETKDDYFKGGVV